MNRFNPLFLKMGTSAIVREAPDEGKPGGTSTPEEIAAEAEAAAAAEAEAAAAAEAEAAAAAEAEAAAVAEAEAAELAAKGGDANAVKLAEEKAELLREVMDKKTKLKAALDDAAASKAKLADFGDVDPEKVRKLLRAESDAEIAKLEASGEFDRVKEMMATAHTAAMESKDAEITALKDAATSNSETIDKLTVGRSFSDSAFIKNNMVLPASKVRALYGDHVGLQNGEVVVFDKPSTTNGAVAMTGADGKTLSFEEGLKRLVEADPDKDTMIKSKMAPGGGSKNTTPGKKTPKKDMNDTPRGAARIVASLDKEGELS